MAEDIAPALLEAIRADFAKALAKLEAEAATWPQAYDYASEVGRALANALQAHLSGDTLPDGKLYWNIADRVVRPMLEQEHTLVAAVAAQVQQNLNEAAGLGLKAQTAALDSDRIDGILNMASNAEKYDTVAGQVSSAVENYSLHTVDETIRQNVEFQGGAGLKPRVIRKAAFGCCPWCTALAGTYTYPGVPKDVYRRHENCNCTVEYDPGDGRRQNVYTKRWNDEEGYETATVTQKKRLQKKSKDDTIKTKYTPSPQRQKKGVQVSAKKYAMLTGTLNTRYPNLTPEDGAKTIYDSRYAYRIEADGYGGMVIIRRTKLK